MLPCLATRIISDVSYIVVFNRAILAIALINKARCTTTRKDVIKNRFSSNRAPLIRYPNGPTVKITSLPKISPSAAARLIAYCQDGSKPTLIALGNGRKAIKQYKAGITQIRNRKNGLTCLTVKFAF